MTKTEKINIGDYINGLTIDFVKAGDEFQISFKNKNLETDIVKVKNLEKTKKLVKQLFSDRASLVTTGFSWTGKQGRLDFCKKLGECGYTYRADNVGIQDVLVKEKPEDLEKYIPIYEDLYKIFNACTEQVELVSANEKYKPHSFEVFNINSDGTKDLVFAFKRSNYMSTIDRKLEVLQNRLDRERAKKEKQKKSIEKKISTLKKLGVSKNELLEMLTNLE